MSATRRLRRLCVVGLIVAVGAGCSVQRGDRDAPGSDGRGAVDTDVAREVVPDRSASIGPDPPAGLQTIEAGVATPRASDRGSGEPLLESLPPEERESDPRSEMVTIKVSVDRPNCAHVWWGVKDLGVAPLEIRRPRGSGPMDLLVRCPGTLTVHTRVFTDRDDRISVHLFRNGEETSMLGYRPAGR